MIGMLRRARQRLNCIVNSWGPAQEVTTLTLRPMPWELDERGQPKAAFRRHMSALAAAGWHADSGQLSPCSTSRPECLSFSGTVALKPFRLVVIATHLAGFEREGIRLGHLLLNAHGAALGSMVTRLGADRPMPESPGERTKSAQADTLRTRIAVP